MQFTSNIIVALLLVVVSSSSTTTAAQESSNLRGVSNEEAVHFRSDFPDDDTPHPGERQLLVELGDNGPVEDGTTSDSSSDHERSLLDGCNGLDSKADSDNCGGCEICCKSLLPSYYYCI